MSQITLQEIKERFTTVQNINQSLKEEKIRTESELNTLQSDYDVVLKELLEKTGATTLEEAVAIFDKKRAELDAEMEALGIELSKYLDTYGEEEND